MTSIRETSKQISTRLDKLERSLKKKLLAFYNQNIAGSLLIIPELRRLHDTTLRNIIRKAVQDSYLQGTDTVGEKISEKNPEFQLFISANDINNIQSFTNKMVEQFWTTSTRLLFRESEFKDGEKKPDLNIPAVLTGLAVSVAFGAFNNAIKNKLPAVIPPATEPTSTLLDQQSIDLNLDIGFEISEIKGRIRFTTQQDAKVDPEICGPLDGQEWDADDPDIVVPIQDTHLWCRCHLIPIVE